MRATGTTVLLGLVMPILDTTIVNVAVGALTRHFHAPIAVTQWAITGYLLALTAAVPFTAWAIGRLGAKAVWVGALALFTAGSALSAAAWSVGALIAFRVVQGLGAGLLMPVGQTLIAQAAGREQMGRAMAMFSLPAMLAPVFGPVLGGWIIDAFGWRWLFLVNVPLCAVALAAALVVLAPGERRTGQRVGRLGFGLFRDRSFASAVSTLVLYSAAMSGLMLVVPLYSQLVQGGDALDAGVLLAPMGLGAAITMPLAGKLTDQGRPRLVGAAGIAVVVAGLAAFALFGGLVPIFVLGLGHGLISPSVMAAAYRTLDRTAIPAATTLSTVAIRLAAPLGTTLLAVVVQGAGFAWAFWVTIGLAALALAPVSLLGRIGSARWKGSSSAPA